MFKSVGRLALVSLVVTSSFVPTKLFGMEMVETPQSEAGPSSCASDLSIIEVTQRQREQTLAGATHSAPIHAGQSGLMYHYPSQDKELQNLLIESSPSSIKSLAFTLLTKRNGTKNKAAVFSGTKGVGKTAVAAVIASRAKWDCIVIDCALLSTETQNEGCTSLDRMVAMIAAQNKPYVIVLDEVDRADGCGAQGNRSNSSKKVDSGVLTVLSNLMQCHKDNPNLFFIATTNHHEKIDKRFTSRCGIFDVTFELPNTEMREKIIRFYLEHNECSKFGVSFDKSVTNDTFIKGLAAKTEGFSGRYLEELVETAWTEKCPELPSDDANEATIKALVDMKVVVDGQLMNQACAKFRKTVDQNKEEEEQEKDVKESTFQSFLKHPLTIATVSIAATVGVAYVMIRSSKNLNSSNIAVQRELHNDAKSHSVKVGVATVVGAGIAGYVGTAIQLYGLKVCAVTAWTVGAPVAGPIAGVASLGWLGYKGYYWMWPK